MKQKLEKFINIIFGTKNNIALKIQISFFITGVLFACFALMSQNVNMTIADTFAAISGIVLAIWLIIAQGNDSAWEIMKEFIRLYFCFFILILSLEFCITSVYDFHGFKLVIYTTISCIGILCCSFYLVSKFCDIFAFFIKIFRQIRIKLFGSVNSETSKIKNLIENITALLVSIAGLGVAIKTIIEPLINLIKQLQQ